uniref:Uncharacterized protein n=1 Tax=Tanacetum cinerariifolium TaxID=118510 RepID=A0A6L2LQJ8_TANCI|nr:hypothetical protein [Tanacetum cinerariifolium]
MSDPDSPAPKPAKATKKSKPSTPKAALVTKPVVAKASKSTSSQQPKPKPKPAPAKTQEKKRKLVTETSDEPSPAKSSKPGLVTKRCKPTSSLSLVDEFIDEDTKEGLTDSDTKSDKEVPHVVKIRAQDEGQARPNLSVQIKGQAGSNPGDDAEPQPQSSPIIHVGPNLKHMDLEATDVSIQQNPKQMDEDFSFGDQFFNDKPFEAENEKTTTETEAESIVSVTIHQDTSAIPPMTSPVIDLISRPDSPNDHQPLPATATATATTTTTITTLPLPPLPQKGTTNSILIKRISKLEQIMANLIQDNKHLEERLDSHGSRLYKLKNLNINQQVSKAIDEIVNDLVDWAIQAPLRNRFRDLPKADMKEILHQRMWETNSYKAHKDHMMLYEALEKSMNRDHTNELLTDLAEA